MGTREDDDITWHYPRVDECLCQNPELVFSKVKSIWREGARSLQRNGLLEAD